MPPSHCLRSLTALLVTLATPLAASAQGVEMPSLSPKARVDQRVGLTDFSLEYSSPAVKGRKIWGTLVPYDKVWRAGANQPTKLTASRDFTWGGAAVKAGSYAVFMVPGKTQWTVHLNTDLAATQNNHDPKKDVAKVSVKPTALGGPRERLLFVWNADAQDDRVNLDMEWERVQIRVPITVDTKAHVNAMIERANAEAWRPQFAAANYLHEAGELDRALALVDKSIAIQATWRNEWLRAQLHKKKGKGAEAAAGAKRAQALGANDSIYEQFYKADITKAATEWK